MFKPDFELRNSYFLTAKLFYSESAAFEPKSIAFDLILKMQDALHPLLPGNTPFG